MFTKCFKLYPSRPNIKRTVNIPCNGKKPKQSNSTLQITEKQHAGTVRAETIRLVTSKKNCKLFPKSLGLMANHLSHVPDCSGMFFTPF